MKKNLEQFSALPFCLNSSKNNETQKNSFNKLERLKPSILLFIFSVVFLSFQFDSIKAQGVIPTKGKEFWLGFLKNYNQNDAGERLDIFITSDVSTNGFLTIPQTGYFQAFSVVAFQTTTITLPNNIAETYNSEIINNKGILIETSDTVSVFAINFEPYTADGSKILPIQSLGTEYRVTSYPGANGSSEFMIVATQDGTQVTITPTASTSGGRPANVPFIVNLNLGQTYQVITNGAGDFTGSTVIATDTSGSCRPFAVFTGNSCTNIPSSCYYCDHIFDQELPRNTWGMTYYAVPFTPATSYTFKILADQNATSYIVNGTLMGMLNAGQSLELNSVTTADYIQANKPVSVTQFMEGRTCAGDGDPAMVHLNSSDQTIDNVTFSTVSSTVITTHTANVIMSTIYTSQLKLDGIPVPPGSFTPFPSNPTQSYAHITLTQGSHTLDADSGFSAYVYGTGQDESYAYSVGSFSKVKPIHVDSVLCTADTVVLGVSNNLFSPWWSLASDPTDTIHQGPLLILTPPIVPDLYVLHGNENISGCNRDFYFNVEVPDPPTVWITQSADTICKFQNVQINSGTFPVSSTYIYNWSPVSGLNNPNIPNPVASPSVSTWYTLAVSTPTGCGGVVLDSIYIHVDNGNISSFDVSADDSTICNGDSSHFIMSIEDIAVDDDFDPAINNAMWSSISGGIASSICGAMQGNALYFNGAGTREAVTNNINVSAGGTIKFGLKIANGVAPCDDADPGEDVQLSYSTNGGATWTVINTYYENLYPNFVAISAPIPAGAQTASTRFRWRQLANSGAGQDNWMLDNVLIGKKTTTGYIFNWFPSTGLSSTTISNPSAAPAVSTWYYGQAIDNSTGCTYTDSIFINVGQPFSLTTTNDTALCSPGGITISTIPGSGSGHTYSWTPVTNLTNPAASSTVATPTSTTTYYVTVTSAQGCVRTDSVTIQVSTLSSVNIVPSSGTICAGDSLQGSIVSSHPCGLNGSVCSGPTSSVQLSNSALSSSSIAETPFCGTYLGTKRQYLILASELNAGGMTSGGTISELALFVNSVVGNGIYKNFNIKMGCTGLSQLTTTFQSSLSTVYNSPSITIANGRNGFAFTSNFDWDGTSNIIVQVCYENTVNSSNSSIFYATSGFNSSVYTYGGSGMCNISAGTVSTSRPKIEFVYCHPTTSNFTYAWTPSGSVSNANTITPSFHPAATTWYQLTTTDNNTGCQFRDSIHVIIAPNFTLTSPNDTSLCSLTSLPFTVNYTSGPGTLISWTPAGLFTNPNAASTTFNPTGTTLCYVTATSAAGCVKTDSIRVNVNSINSINVTPDSSYNCSGDTIITSSVITRNCGPNGNTCTGPQSNIQVNNGSIATSATNAISLFCGANLSTRRQYLFLASELTALGMTPGSSISEISFFVPVVSGSANYTNFSIKMGCTALTQVTSTFVNGLATIFNPATITLVNGQNNFHLDETYGWDGTSNLILEVCFENATNSANSTISYHNTAFNSAIGAYGNTGLCNTTTGSVTLARPNTLFKFCQGNSSSLLYSWSPAAGVSNTTIANPKLYPNTSTTYHLTMTDPLTGCTFTDSVHITIGTFNLVVNASNDTAVCSALGLQLNVNHNAPGPVYYNWTPANHLNNASIASPVITVDGTQTYVVTVSDTSGCSVVSDTVHILVPAPAIITVTPDTSVCLGNSIVISASGGSSYVWSPVTGLSTPNSASTNAGPVVPTTYHLTATDSVGCIISDSVHIDINYLPVVNLGNDTTFCQGGTAHFNAGAGFISYHWQDGTTNSTLNATATGYYWVDVENQCGITRDSVHVTVHQLPVVNLGPDITVCQGTPVVLNAGTNAPTYLWNTSATTQTINVSTTGNYTVTITDNNNCSNRDTVHVQFVAPPTVNLGADTTLCTGQTLVLNGGNPGSTYSWSTTDVTQTITVTAAGIYYVEVDNGSCTRSDTIQVSYQAPPVVALGPDITVCAGTYVTLDAGNPGMLYHWSNGQTTQVMHPFASNTFWVQVTNQYGCVGTDTAQVTYIPYPVVSLGADTSICAGATITLNAANTGSAYLWSTNETTQTITTGVAGSYIVSVTNTTNCTTIDTIQIGINQLPVISLGNDTIICAGLFDNLTPGIGYQAYLWSTNATSSSINVGAAGTYTVTVTDNHGCQGSDAIDVAIKALPIVTVSPAASVCLGDSITITSYSPEGVSYQWSPTAGLSNPTSPSTFAHPATPTNYTVTVLDTIGCAGIGTVNVSLLYLPTVNLGADTAFCFGDVVTFNATSGISTYLWSDNSTGATFTTGLAGTYWVDVTNVCGTVTDTVVVTEIYPTPIINLGPGGQICTVPQPVVDAGNPGATYLWSTSDTTQTIEPTESGTYSVLVTSEHGCFASSSITIDLVNPPVVSFGPDTIMCEGNVIELDALNDFATYLWQDGSINPNYIVNQTGLYWVNVDNLCGTASDSIHIEYSECYCSIYVPNAFTPNGDGINERFHPEILCTVNEYTMQIFNRWGQLVFETHNVDNGWDGKYQGTDAPQDLYVYTIYYNASSLTSSRTEKVTGNVSLIR